MSIYYDQENTWFSYLLHKFLEIRPPFKTIDLVGLRDKILNTKGLSLNVTGYCDLIITK